MTAPLETIGAFVLDMDGTVYLGERLLPGASSFVDYLRRTGTPFLFFTNNSSKSTDDYVTKLGRLGIATGPDEVMTSGSVMIDYLKRHHPGEPVHLLGTPALAGSFAAAGIALDPAAAVAVAGFDTTLTYDRLAGFCDALRSGAVFYATHPDLNCPVEGGFIPDLGALLALIEASTGRRPDLIVGKPYRPTVEAVARRLAVPAGQLAFVGDRLYTDIAVAVDHGAAGLLVLSGETTAADLAGSSVRPDGVFDNLADLLGRLEGGTP